jgi:hypothetical protein
MGRRLRLWGLALGGSLLLHVSLIWLLPQWTPAPDALPFEVQLVSVPAPVVLPPPVPAPPAAKSPAPRLPPPRGVRALPEPLAEPAAEAAAPAAPADAESIDTAVVSAEPAPAAEPAPIEAVAPPLNALPQRLDLRYQVSYGLASGEQTLLWVNEGERYTLTSVAGATGLAGVFYRGRFVQTSRGRITPRGLQPEEFWDQRGNKRSSARFDAVNGNLTLEPAKGAPRHFAYSGDTQDALSLFFQLALTAPPQEGKLTYTVFNGKKLRVYTYEVRGEVMLETALGTLRTLHLARVVDGDGRFEAWLAIDRHYLPVRVLRSDENGIEAELRLQSIAP